ncbi:hypothetical protein NERG_02164 [Nematocida ausubeli]|uniref:E3 ubiquitin protein ligase n=1 Tax=Nematocida ausubeli (strain ATCC PRA-371 / ERTm2) TaxID=1913371 RepID=H8ZEZ5_NEMA1|nr:hypothetical protein NERG_02164 [Nematocida ausubeli]
MEKRRAGVPPLKKIAYDATASGESNWWDEAETAAIEQRKVDAIFSQMEEYKKVAEEAVNEKQRIQEIKIDELLSSVQGTEVGASDACEMVKTAVLNCREHLFTISQLRKRAAQMKETPQKEKPSISKDEITGYIERVDALENQVHALISKCPPNYTKLAKTLEQENKELFLSIEELTKKIESLLQKEQSVRQEMQEMQQSMVAASEAAEAKQRVLQKESKQSADEKIILQKRVDELYLALETLNSTIVDRARDLENTVDNKIDCVNDCHLKIKELQDKEIDRLEEVAFLVRKYIDTGKKNDSLLLELAEVQNELKLERDRPTAECTQKTAVPDTQKIEEEVHALRRELERSQVDYLERKASAHYHKRKAVQYEADLALAKKTAASLEAANKALHDRLQILQNSTKTVFSSETDIELYQRMIRCSVCCTNIKDVALKRCMHLLCRSCIDSRMASRQKTCPLCGTTCTPSDIVSVYL